MKQKTILYVDDEEPNLVLFRYAFMAELDVITVSSPDEGLKVLSEHPEIQTVISDMRMPIMNGLEFIAIAKKRHPNVGFYLLTGFDQSGEIQSALESNLIKAYFNKPFNKEKVLAAIGS
jgi:response regulator RpfG family c-di-GMP phosphodiesterase